MATLMESISGLRGVYGSGINSDYAFKVACRFAGWLGSSDVVVGMDTRDSSLVLSKAILSGLMHGGCNPLWAGFTTTPELFRHVKRESLKAGVMVTASHNPKEWNGIKLIKSGRGVFEEELENILSSDCTISHFGQPMVTDTVRYFDEVLAVLGRRGVSGLKVALDLGGGSACYHVPSLFRDTGVDVVVINGTPGIFCRTIDPTQDELVQLRRIVTSEGCDVGFAFDCDGDRLQVVDGSGHKLPPDFALFVYVNRLKSGEKVALSVDTSDVVFEAAKKVGAETVIAPVGEANVVRAIIKDNCKLGGEGSSAGVIDPSFSLCRDGLLAAMGILAEISKKGKLELDSFKNRYTLRTKLEIERRIIPKILELFLKEHPDALTLDGIKYRTDEGWVLLRPSRTEDVLRVSIESSSEAKALRYAEHVKNKISKLGGKLILG
jgi:phosphoglucosamine mutase